MVGDSICLDVNEMYKELDFNKIILLSLTSKKWFIETDEFDQKERLLLNFGHTFGHAFESSTNYKISHGISVGYGMAVAIEISKIMGYLNDEGKDYADKMLEFLKTFSIIHDMDKLKIEDFDYESYMEALKNDKKHEKNKYKLILPYNDGLLQLVSLEKSKKIEQILISTSKKYIEDFNFIKKIN